MRPAPGRVDQTRNGLPTTGNNRARKVQKSGVPGAGVGSCCGEAATVAVPGAGTEAPAHQSLQVNAHLTASFTSTAERSRRRCREVADEAQQEPEAQEVSEGTGCVSGSSGSHTPFAKSVEL